MGLEELMEMVDVQFSNAGTSRVKEVADMSLRKGYFGRWGLNLPARLKETREPDEDVM